MLVDTSLIESLTPAQLAALESEFKKGLHKNWADAERDRAAMAKKNQKHHRGVDGLGKFKARIPADAFHYWGQRFSYDDKGNYIGDGYKCWQDKAFIEEFLRDNPQCAVAGGATKSQVAFSAGTILDGSGKVAV